MSHATPDIVYKSDLEEYPFAVVVWWTAWRVAIHCPFCSRIHHHGCMPPREHDLTLRVSHCGHGSFLSYRLLFPFSAHEEVKEGKLGWEIDKARKRFKTIGFEEDDRELEKGNDEEYVDSATDESADSEENECDEWEKQEEGSSTDISQLSVRIDPTNYANDDEFAKALMEGAKLNFERRIQKFLEQTKLPKNLLEDDWDGVGFVGNCLHKQLNAAKALYAGFDTKERLILAKNRQGDTVLSMVAAEGHEDVFKFLLEEGAELNTTNNKGRTPLMEAALRGRLAIVQLLLKEGASTRVTDNEGRTALELAEDTRRNEEERRGQNVLYAENLDEKSQRRGIVGLLGGTVVRASKPSGIVIGSGAAARILQDWRSGSLVLLTPSVEIPVERFSKTIAFLDRGGAFPVVYAKRGWNTASPKPEYLDNVTWTENVMRLCSAIEYLLPSHDWDHSYPGRFNACHAEKQLMAFYLFKHRILPHELENDSELRQLREQFPSGGGVREIWIYVSTPPCDDCENFRRRLEALAEVSIQLQYIPTVN